MGLASNRRQRGRCGERCCSPGRPPGWQRDQVQRFWLEIAKGAASDEAAVSVGVASAVGTRWFREAGGMRPVSLAPLSGRYLSFAEREEIAILKAKGCGVREIARQTKPFAVDDQPRAAPQCRHPGGVVGLSGHQCAMAR